MEPENTVLIIEALMREMTAAKRWLTVEVAWEAMLRVRQMAKDHAKQIEKVTPKSDECKRGR